MFDYFQRYCRRNPGKLKLVLMGKPIMTIPDSEDIISLGFVAEDVKYAVMGGAVALTLFSSFESLSIVVLESMAMRRPVVVNGACEVLRGHCERSGAGLYFTNYYEFAGALDYLLENQRVYEIMRGNARSYVAENYRWDVILSRMREMIEAMD